MSIILITRRSPGVSSTGAPAALRSTLRLGEALEILKTLPDAETDLVFIDADKQNYSAYYREAMRILRNGGLILADNALWYGRIFDPKDDESRAMADFNELVKADNRAEKLFLTIRDGIYLIRKRGQLTCPATSSTFTFFISFVLRSFISTSPSLRFFSPTII